MALCLRALAVLPDDPGLTANIHMVQPYITSFTQGRLPLPGSVSPVHVLHRHIYAAKSIIHIK